MMVSISSFCTFPSQNEKATQRVAIGTSGFDSYQGTGFSRAALFGLKGLLVPETTKATGYGR
jgi:hypothetical protein